MIEIAVLGAGYVGLVSGACFSTFGIKVHFVETLPERLASLRRQEVPFFEPGLQDILEDSAKRGLIETHASITELYARAKPTFVFVCLGTPSREDGSCDMSHVEAALRELAERSPEDSIVVLKSTVPVGTASDLKRRFGVGRRLRVINNPEFLREGTAIQDFMRPERIVIGGEDEAAVNGLRDLYEPLLRNGHPCLTMSSESAEAAKLSANLALAARISLINQISRFADATGADIKSIEKVLKSDSRIGSKYLYAGMGYGGSCFPKDVKSYLHQCRAHEVDASIAEAVERANETQKTYFLPKIRSEVAAGATVALLGIAFKPETDDIREAPALALCEALAEAGYRIHAYDPQALENFEKWLSDKPWRANVTLCANATDALRTAEAMVLVTEWREFQSLDRGGLKHLFRGRVVFDGKNIFQPERVREMGYRYFGIGRR